MEYLILDQIKSPQDIKKLNLDELHKLSTELREFILNSVSQTGGHLASSLGCIELTIALHYVYDTPEDLLVWDVGHQSYPHKILTGRKDMMPTLRKYGGLAGFPKRDESVYDTFGVGHSSTSISAALGMAVALAQKQIDNKVVAIIGDGSMTSGLAFEGLNNAGWLNPNMLVILNDNEMSISENVGAISRYLSKILASGLYNTVKQTANKALSLVPSMQKIAQRVEEHVKGMIMPGTLFEELGFNYIGPLDGHDLELLIDTLQHLKDLPGAQFLHIVTKKGKGYKLAENNPIGYHGVVKFDLDQGMVSGKPTNPNLNITYTHVFGHWLCDLGELEKNFVAITPAMREGSGMVEFAKKYPDKFFDVAIAEQHAVTFAAGVATQGVKPIVAIYSTFLQRGYDQLIHDVAIQDLPVMFAIDRAGVVGADGPTHIGAFDLSYCRIIPNLIVMAPSDKNECYQMLWFAYRLNKATCVRYPRGGDGEDTQLIREEDPNYLSLGKAKLIRSGQDIAILSFGSMLNVTKVAADELNASLYDMRFIKPLDQELIKQLSVSHKYVVTCEENVVAGGAGSAVCEYLAHIKAQVDVLNLGLPDEFPPHGDPKQILQSLGLDSTSIIARIKQFIGEK